MLANNTLKLAVGIALGYVAYYSFKKKTKKKERLNNDFLIGPHPKKEDFFKDYHFVDKQKHKRPLMKTHQVI